MNLRNAKHRAKPTRRNVLFAFQEILEDRLLMTASLASIANVTAPTLQGTVVALDGSGTTDAQTFKVTSSNPDIAASIATGKFWTVNVGYLDESNPADDFSGPLTFQLFDNLTPIAASELEEFTTDGYYTGKTFTRIVPGFVVQGGAPNSDGTGSSGQPGTPYPVEPVQQLAFSGSAQLGIANTGAPDSNDTQFFVTLGEQSAAQQASLNYNYTLCGQLIAGASTLAKMAQVPLQQDGSTPENLLEMNSVSLSTTNPNGALIIDTTQANEGETATISVTATDSVDHTTVSRSFTVTVGAYSGPADPPINFRPQAASGTESIAINHTANVTLGGQGGYPDTTQTVKLTYQIVTQPAHGTISNFNATAGTLVYTPDPGFVGTDTFQYDVSSTGPEALPSTLVSNVATVTTIVTRPADDFTGANENRARSVPSFDGAMVRTGSERQSEAWSLRRDQPFRPPRARGLL